MSALTPFHFLFGESSEGTDQDTASSFQNGIQAPGTTTTSFEGRNCILGSDECLPHCLLCFKIVSKPKVLPCLHSFCQHCLEKQQQKEKLICPYCREEFLLNSIDISNLEADCTDKLAEERNKQSTPCTDQCMNGFESPTVMSILSENKDKATTEFIPPKETISCPYHRTEDLRYFCKTCNDPVCKECIQIDHPIGQHEFDILSEVQMKQFEELNETIEESKLKVTSIKSDSKMLEHTLGLLQINYQKAQNDINDTFQFFNSTLSEQKQELLKKLEITHSEKQIYLHLLSQKATQTVDKINKGCLFYEELKKNNSIVECLAFKKYFERKLQELTSFTFDGNCKTLYDLEFVSNYQAIQAAVQNTFGYLRTSYDIDVNQRTQSPIAESSNKMDFKNSRIDVNGTSEKEGMKPILNSEEFSLVSADSRLHLNSNINPKQFYSKSFLDSFSGASTKKLNINTETQREIQSNLSDLTLNNNKSQRSLSLPDNDSMANSPSTSFIPIIPLLERKKMRYYNKIGEYGGLTGQFIEPTGVAVNGQNDVIVADANNHRVQVFDMEGRFKFQFGGSDGEAFYPHRIAVIKHSGDIVIVERKPAHQIQIYNQYGLFIKKFGQKVLRHPRAVAVDNKGRIVVIECKIMRAVIFDLNGNVLYTFGFSKYVEFPNSVAVNEEEEIFISDNRSHCVKIFNYKGIFLRQIGREGETCFPISVGISQLGEILIADNHNSFNLTIYTQGGQFLAAFESQVKHSQCLDVAFTYYGTLIVATKEYQLFFYRYR